MKQIKVYITPEQWAEKRLQLISSSYMTQKGFLIETIDFVIEQCGFELIEAETKPEQPIIDKKVTKSNHPNALKYDELIQGEYYLKCKKTMFMEDGDRAATKGYYYPSDEMYNVFAGELSEAGCLDHILDDTSFLFEYFETYQHFPND